MALRKSVHYHCFLILIIAFAARAMTDSTQNGMFKENGTMASLIHAAGCESRGTLISKGACFEPNYNKESPANLTFQIISYTFVYYGIFAVNEKEKKVSFNFGLLKEWEDNRVKTNFSYAPKNLWYGTNWVIQLP